MLVLVSASKSRCRETKELQVVNLWLRQNTDIFNEIMSTVSLHKGETLTKLLYNFCLKKL